MTGSYEEKREVLIEALEALQRRLRDNVKVRPERKDHYDPMKARQYHIADDLIDRLRRGLNVP